MTRQQTERGAMTEIHLGFVRDEMDNALPPLAASGIPPSLDSGGGSASDTLPEAVHVA